MTHLLSKAEWEEIDLEKIDFHPCISETVRDELATHSYALERPDILLSLEAVKALQVSHPVLLTPADKRNRYYCLSGIRVLCVIRQIQKTGGITAGIISKLTPEEIIQICFSDLYLAPLCFSYHSKKDLFTFSKNIPQAVLKRVSGKAASNVKAFAKSLGLSAQSLYNTRLK